MHWGATSQDVIDTALVLQLRAAIGDVLTALDRAADAAADLARRHVATPIAGRTWLQQATPTTFGAKAAAWLDGLARVRQRLAMALDDALAVQLGGATGTLSSLGPPGPAAAAALAAGSTCACPTLPWHTERSRLVDVACALGMTCGALGKVGRDIALLAQTEVGEVAEAPAPGRGGSSSMPHKRNPVRSARAVAAAVQAPGLVATMLSAMVQEHERAVGGWQAEWDTLPALVDLTREAAQAMAEALAHLVVDEARMRANLDAAGGVARAEGLVAALAPALGRRDAHGAGRTHLPPGRGRRPRAPRRRRRRAAAARPPRRRRDRRARSTRRRFPGSSHTFVDRVLARWQREKAVRTAHGRRSAPRQPAWRSGARCWAMPTSTVRWPPRRRSPPSSRT